MIVCPLCSHPQETGTVCDECGKVLASPAATAEAPIARMAEVDATLFAAAPAPADEFPFDELEPTAELRLPSYQVDRVAELEATAKATPGSAIPILPLDEMDTGRAEFVGAPTKLSASQVTCRYCRQPQAKGLLCAFCGMRLPAAAQAPAASARLAATDERLRCSGCGAPVAPGSRCGDCGTMSSGE